MCPTSLPGWGDTAQPQLSLSPCPVVGSHPTACSLEDLMNVQPAIQHDAGDQQVQGLPQVTKVVWDRLAKQDDARH